MLIGAIIPHLDVWGGVRRYLEMGNAFVKMGHQYHLYCLKMGNPWIPFKGDIFKFSDHKQFSHDLVLTGARDTMELLDDVRGEVKSVMVVDRMYPREYLNVYEKWGNEYFWVGVNHGWRAQFEGRIMLGYTCPGGVNTDLFKPDPSRRQETKRVIFYARPQPRANLMELEDGINHFLSECPCDWEFVGYDNGDKSQTINERIKFQQNKDQYEMVELMQSADFAISLKNKGMWDNNIAEAMACGCLPIANYSDTIGFLVDGHNCRIARNAEEVQDALEYFYYNPDEIERISANAQEDIKNYSWVNYCKRYLELMEAWKNSKREEDQ